MRLPVSGVLGALLALIAFPGEALASTIASYSSSTGLLVQGDAVGEGVTVGLLPVGPRRFQLSPTATGSLAGNQIVFGTLAAGPGCTATTSGSSTFVTCQAPGSVVVTARLGDGDDFIRLAGAPADGFLDGEAGNDVVSGGDGFDAIAGSAGRDRLSGGGGNDVIEGGDDDDVFSGDGHGEDGSGGSDVLRGGAGDDLFKPPLTTAPTPDRFEGGTGEDVADYSQRTGRVILSTTIGGTAEAANDGALNEGDDLIGVETMMGGSGNDSLRVTVSTRGAAFGVRTMLGNAGNDNLRIQGAVRSFLDPGLGTDSVIGGDLNDTLFTRDGEADAVACGGGTDTITADLRDNPQAPCENIDQGAVKEGPNVVFRSSSARLHADGSLAVRLSCPRKLRQPCAGRLTARADRKGARPGPPSRYSIRPGRSVTVQVTLGRRTARVRLRSVERGTHGTKTTQRVLPVRR